MSIKNDRWSALSLKDRADLMNMYITNGISDLKEMKKHYNGIPYRDLNTSDYDYFNASPEMAPTKEGQHWDSRNPHTGRLLKGESHPTFDLMVDGENKAGYKIVRGYNGELYSIPNTPDNYVENYNRFDDGGDVDNFDIEPAIITGTSNLTNAFFKDFSDRYYNYHNKNIEDKVQKVLSKDTKRNKSKTGVYYNPITDEITLSPNSNAISYTHELTHKLNNSFPKRISRTKSEKKLLKDAYPLGNRDDHGKLYELFVGPTEYFTTNTELRRRISQHYGNVTGNELNDVISNMSDEQLAEFAGASGYNSPDDYYVMPSDITDGKSYYNKFRLQYEDSPEWEALSDKQKELYEYRFKTGLGKRSFKTYDENKLKLVRQALINVAANGGRILDGTETEQTLSGKKPTLEEYIQHKIDSVRNAALEKSYNRKTGVLIPYELTPSRKKLDEDNVISMREYADTSFVGPSLPIKEEKKKITGNLLRTYQRHYYKALKELEDNCEYGLNCIGTATDNYPQDSHTDNNNDFRENHSNYGFISIDESKAEPGDIVQSGAHGMIYASNNDGERLFNWSSGGPTEFDYVTNGHFGLKGLDYYRYVGTPKLIQQWTDEYNNKKAFGGRILDGIEEDQTLSGVSVDTSKPILNREQYLQQQRDNVRVKALQNSLNRTEPSNPVFENSQSQEEWEQDRLARIDYLVTRLYNAQTDEESEMLNLGIRGIENETYSPIMFGNNCIYTALDNYGKKYKVPGNLSFLANPGKYGFKEIKTSDIKPGDLVQKILTGNNHHMMVFDSYDDNGLPLYNYSSSQSKTASDIKKKSHYYGENINDNNTYRAFTFIGNAEDNDVWNNDYNQYRKDYSSKILEELKNVPSLSKDFIKTDKKEKLLTKRK